jgi:hypothetical protein
MAQTAANLVDHVLPHQPYRQWVLSLPYPLRFLAAREPEVLSVTLAISQKIIQRFLTADLAQGAHTGGIAVVQRFGSALNLNPHFHILMLDGYYHQDHQGKLQFVQSRPPSKDQIQTVCIKIAQAVAKKLEKMGYLVKDLADGHYLSDQEVDLLGDLQSHSITYRIAVGPRRGQKVFQLQLLPPSDEPANGSHDPCAQYAGFNLHAGLKIGSKRRDKLEKLCRYIARPPLAHARLSMTEDEKVSYRLKTPFRNGATHVIFETEDFIAKLAALVPPPRANLIRYFGVFAPASPLRRDIVPKPIRQENPKQGGGDKPVNEKQRHYIPWAQLLKRVFRIDVEKCSRCGAKVKVVAVINEHKIIERILSHLEKTGRFNRAMPTYRDIISQHRRPPELIL